MVDQELPGQGAVRKYSSRSGHLRLEFPGKVILGVKPGGLSIYFQLRKVPVKPGDTEYTILGGSILRTALLPSGGMGPIEVEAVVGEYEQLMVLLAGANMLE